MLLTIPKLEVGCKIDFIVPFLLVQLHDAVPVADKVSQKCAIDDFVKHTRTHGTKSWLPEIIEVNLTDKLPSLRD